MAKFKYKQRESATYEKRAHQSSSSRDEVIDPRVKTYSPKEGDNVIRILPPTWDDAEHFGYEVFVHYGIGVDKNQYLSLQKMKGVPDPIHEERLRAEAAGDLDYAKQLNPAKRVLVWIIDRDNEKDGPLLWSMPWTVDRDLCNRARDRRTGQVYHIDHPEEGYDIGFTKKGKGQTTKYEAIEIFRDSTPLSPDTRQAEKWVDFIVENPIPELLIYHDYDHIAEVMKGHVAAAQQTDGDDRNERKEGRGDSGRTSGRSSKPSKPSLPTYDELMEMSLEELDELCEANAVDLFADDFKESEDFAVAVAEALGVEPGKRDRASRDDDSPARRLRGR